MVFARTQLLGTPGDEDEAMEVWHHLVMDLYHRASHSLLIAFERSIIIITDACTAQLMSDMTLPISRTTTSRLDTKERRTKYRISASKLITLFSQ